MRDHISLEVDAHIDRLAVLIGLASPHAVVILLESRNILKPLSSIRDLAWPSVKLFAPATGAPGIGGLFGELTAGVFASRFAGGVVCAKTGTAEASSRSDIRGLRIGISFVVGDRELTKTSQCSSALLRSSAYR